MNEILKDRTIVHIWHAVLPFLCGLEGGTWASCVISTVSPPTLSIWSSGGRDLKLTQVSFLSITPFPKPSCELSCICILCIHGREGTTKPLSEYRRYIWLKTTFYPFIFPGPWNSGYCSAKSKIQFTNPYPVWTNMTTLEKVASNVQIYVFW